MISTSDSSNYWLLTIFFLIQDVIFLALGVANDFQWGTRHFGCYKVNFIHSTFGLAGGHSV